MALLLFNIAPMDPVNCLAASKLAALERDYDLTINAKPNAPMEPDQELVEISLKYHEEQRITEEAARQGGSELKQIQDSSSSPNQPSAGYVSLQDDEFGDFVNASIDGPENWDGIEDQHCESSFSTQTATGPFSLTQERVAFIKAAMKEVVFPNPPSWAQKISEEVWIGQLRRNLKLSNQ